MITVNFEDLLTKLTSNETKSVLTQNNIAVIENSEPSLEENSAQKSYHDNVQKIKDFVNSDYAHEKPEIKKFQNQCNLVIKSPFFTFNDIGKKAIKSIIQYKFWNLLVTLLNRNFNSVDDESLGIVLHDLFNADEDPINKTETSFHQHHESLIQDNASYRKFYEVCSDLLDLDEEDLQSSQKYFMIYVACLLCQKPMEKIWFMRALMRFKTKRIQNLLEILYFIAVPLSSEYDKLGMDISLKTIYEYISWTVSSTFEKIKKDKNIQHLLDLLSKALDNKLHETEALTLLNNLNSFAQNQSLKMENIDLRKNLNLEDFKF